MKYGRHKRDATIAELSRLFSDDARPQNYLVHADTDGHDSIRRGLRHEHASAQVPIAGFRAVLWRQLPEGDTVYYNRNGKIVASTVTGFGRFERDEGGEDPIVVLSDKHRVRCSELLWKEHSSDRIEQ